ncbi:hypothetical protein CPR19092_LGOLGGFK_01347 [Companilactobacillus paralimentarius]|uniref:bifunctional helix-turn-helix transcriptional regulator/GNAT family N-acetyltransferase n=1 Tax=Companilactobacillus paralimentarius TaxID=83526 RepID=UPI00384BFD55
MNKDIEKIRDFNRFYANYFNRFEKELYQGFPSMNEARVMAFLHFHQSSTATDIQNELGFDKGQLSKMLTKLEKKGILKRTLNPEDRRHYLLDLTSTGEELHKELADKARDYLKNIFKDYTPSVLEIIANDVSEAQMLFQQTEDIKVRRGNMTDLGFIADLHSRIYSTEIPFNSIFHRYVLQTLAELADDSSKSLIWIAQLGSRRVGTVSLVQDANGKYQLRWFAVDPDYQGLGIGTKLLNTLIDQIKLDNIDEVYLWTVDELTGARNLYRKLKFNLIESKVNNNWSDHPIHEEKWLYRKENEIMADEKTELMRLIDTAYNNVQNNKYGNFRKELLKYYTALNNDEDYIKVLLGLRSALLQADLTLNLKQRISGLPGEYSDMFKFIEPQLKKVDSKTIDKYSHYGFVPLKLGSTVKYF